MSWKISKAKVDYAIESGDLPDDYPMKLFLDIHPIGDISPPESCTLSVLGLAEELSFNLSIPSLTGMFSRLFLHGSIVRTSRSLYCLYTDIAGIVVNLKVAWDRYFRCTVPS